MYESPGVVTMVEYTEPRNNRGGGSRVLSSFSSEDSFGTPRQSPLASPPPGEFDADYIIAQERRAMMAARRNPDEGDSSSSSDVNPDEGDRGEGGDESSQDSHSCLEYDVRRLELRTPSFGDAGIQDSPAVEQAGES